MLVLAKVTWTKDLGPSTNEQHQWQLLHHVLKVCSSCCPENETAAGVFSFAFLNGCLCHFHLVVDACIKQIQSMFQVFMIELSTRDRILHSQLWNTRFESWREDKKPRSRNSAMAFTDLAAEKLHRSSPLVLLFD